jgi:hypothetical protein
MHSCAVPKNLFLSCVKCEVAYRPPVGAEGLTKLKSTSADVVVVSTPSSFPLSTGRGTGTGTGAVPTDSGCFIWLRLLALVTVTAVDDVDAIESDEAVASAVFGDDILLSDSLLALLCDWSSKSELMCFRGASLLSNGTLEPTLDNALSRSGLLLFATSTVTGMFGGEEDIIPLILCIMFFLVAGFNSSWLELLSAVAPLPISA